MLRLPAEQTPDLLLCRYTLLLGVLSFLSFQPLGKTYSFQLFTDLGILGRLSRYRSFSFMSTVANGPRFWCPTRLAFDSGETSLVADELGCSFKFITFRADLKGCSRFVGCVLIDERWSSVNSVAAVASSDLTPELPRG